MVIGIGGVSRAGKTTLARKIRDLFPRNQATVLCQDDYVKPTDLIPKIDGRINWEHPDSIDHEAFRNAIQNEMKQNDVVIAEGLMVFHDPKTVDLFDKKIFVELDHKNYILRKKKDLRWGVEPDWYIEHIWNSFLQYGKPKTDKSFLIIDGNTTDTLLSIGNFLQTKKNKTG